MGNNEKLQIPSPNLDLSGYIRGSDEHNFGSTPKSAKGLVRLWEGIQRKKGEIPLDKIQFTVELGIENQQISGCLHYFS